MSKKWGKTRSKVTAQRDEPRSFVITSTAGECAIQAADEASGKLGTFEGNAYTGATMRPDGWWNKLVIDLSGVIIPSQHRPVLRQHDHEQIVGHTTSVTVDKDGIKVGGTFSGQKEHVEKVTVPAKNGFKWQLSIGADPVKTQFLEAGEEDVVNGQKVVGPLTISRETRLGEISFVPLGADGKTSVSVAASKGKPMNAFAASLKQLMSELRAAGKAKAAKYSDEDIDKMSVDQARMAVRECMAAMDDDEPDDDDDDDKKSKSSAIQTIRAEADAIIAETRKRTVAELKRQDAITAAVKKHGVGEIEIDGKRVNLAAHAIEHGWTEEKAELEALRRARPSGSVGVPGGLGFVASTPEMSEAVLEAAVFHAARHQMRLQDDDWYLDTMPDGKTKTRRVPLHLQREAQSGFNDRYTDKAQQAAHDLFFNTRSHSYVGQFGLQMLFRMAMRAKGVTEDFDLRVEAGCDRMLRTWAHTEPNHAETNGRTAIRAEGSSNLSIGNVLANVLNKFALQGYLYVEQAWRRFCAIRSVQDFKPSKSINLLGDVMYKELGPSGELSNASLGDQAFANQAKMFGRILTIPMMHLINDDLSILTGAPTKIGQGAGLALNDNVWTLFKNMLTSSVKGDDNVDFFRTTSSTTDAAKKAGTAYKPNKTTGALTATTLATSKALLDNQIDPNGNPIGFTGVKPVLLYGPTNWQTVIALMYAPGIVYGGASASLQPNMNVWAGYADPVMSAYVENATYINSTTAYFLILDAVMTSIIEVCFLNGVDTPTVLQASPDFQFDRPGITIRGTMPFGSNQQNFRCGVYSTGA